MEMDWPGHFSLVIAVCRTFAPPRHDCWGGMVSAATGSGAASTGMKKTAEMIRDWYWHLIPALRHDPRCEVVALAGTEAALMAELAQAANVARGLGRGGAPRRKVAGSSLSRGHR
jgi:hypothetical protein